MADDVIDPSDAADEVVGNTIMGLDQISDTTYVLHVRNGQPIKIKSLTPISFFISDGSEPDVVVEPDEEIIPICRFCGFSGPSDELCKTEESSKQCAGALYG